MENHLNSKEASSELKKVKGSILPQEPPSPSLKQLELAASTKDFDTGQIDQQHYPEYFG